MTGSGWCFAPIHPGVSFITAGLSYARALTDRIAVGTTIKLISESIDDMEATGVALDAGMTYVVGESGLRLGVSLKNIGNALQYSGTGLIRQVQLPGQPGNATNNAVAIESEGVELPTLLNFGAAYTRQVGAGATLTVLGNFRSNSFDQDQYSGGLELGFQEIVYLRGGIELTQDSDLTFFQGFPLLVVCGSIYLVGDVRTRLYENFGEPLSAGSITLFGPSDQSAG